MPKARAPRRVAKTSKRTSGSRRSSRAPSPFHQVLAALAVALKGERWFVFGAQAVALHGVPRSTADVDVTLEPPRRGVAALVNHLAKHGFELAEVGDVESFIAATRVLPFVHRETAVSLDLVLSGPGLEEAIHARARPMKLGRIRIPVISVNDLIVLKVLAGRPKDLEDARALIRGEARGLKRAQVVEVLAELESAIDVADLLPRLNELWPA